MQVFYVNIGGGEPTVRKDFWELVEYATAHHVGVKFSTNGSRIDAERARVAARQRLRRRADLARRRDGGGQRPRPRRGVLRDGDARDGVARRHGVRSSSVVVTRENVGAARRVQGDRGPVRRAAAADAAAAVRARRGRVGRAASHAGAAARGLRLAARARRGGADRRLVLPPRRLRRSRCRG